MTRPALICVLLAFLQFAPALAQSDAGNPPSPDYLARVRAYADAHRRPYPGM